MNRYLARIAGTLALLGTGLLASGFAAAQTQVDTPTGNITVTILTDRLSHPWGLAFLPDHSGMLITERPGRLRHVEPDGTVHEPITGTPEVFARGQGGLLDVALSPDFAHDRLVYLAYAEAAQANQAGTAVGRGRLNEALDELEGFEVIFRQVPAQSTGHHFGVRLVFDASGEHLFIALGEHNQRATAQDLQSLQGKVVRIHPDGSIPADNPFVGRADARPEIWSYGHRNPQGATLHPLTGALWIHEHGPRGGDEINLPEPGGNFGWPLATHGRNYTGLPIPEAQGRTLPGGVEPWHVWERSPAVSGMAFYTGHDYPDWHGNLFIGALASRELIRLTLDDGKVVDDERLLGELNHRIRDVRQGPDDRLYLLTDADPGLLLRLDPTP